MDENTEIDKTEKPSPLSSQPVANLLGLFQLQDKALPTICIDIDGTIAPYPDEANAYSTVKPFPGAKDTINSLKNLGIKIIIFTSRNNEWKGITEYWLKEEGISYDELIMDKPKAQLYIDDRGFRFIAWSEVINKLLLPQVVNPKED